MKVRIYQPIQQPMQRGHVTGGHWLIEPEPETRRYPEPLMGWTASGDTLNTVKLNFSTLEEARNFAEKKGWEYSVTPEHERHTKPRNYIDNFKTRGDREARD
jgi:hypothetical protein